MQAVEIQEIYRAKASLEAARTKARTTNPFTIEVRFLSDMTQAQRDAFKEAADRWCRVIVGDLPSVLIDGEVIDDLVIEAQRVHIDGPRKILGQAGPTHVRPAVVGKSAFLPAKGIMSFDEADLDAMEQDGTLNDVITHEMGHVLGIGTIWELKSLLGGKGTVNPTFVGPNAMAEYAGLVGAAAAVPVENVGGAGTRDSHWREQDFADELMTGFVGAANNPLSRLTVASLADLGYEVDMDAAEPYELPDPDALPAVVGPLTELHAGEVVYAPIQIILPEESLS